VRWAVNPLEVFEITPGSFAVCGMGQFQSHDPELTGFVAMSRERADEVAQALRLLLDFLPTPDEGPQ
jgi:hypothetical protein